MNTISCRSLPFYTHQFFIGVLREKGGGGRGKIAEIAERAAHFGRQSVKEEGAVACHEQPRIAIPP